MSLRPPQSLSGPSRVETGFNVLQHEIAQQKAEALGLTAHRLKAINLIDKIVT